MGRRLCAGVWTAFGGYSGTSLIAASMNRALSGQAPDRWKRSRRLLRRMTAPISKIRPSEWLRRDVLPWRLDGGVISTNLVVLWEISDYLFHRAN